jgi:two-component system cell cycle sensor histidine kinase/response regulator CckA
MIPDGVVLRGYALGVVAVVMGTGHGGAVASGPRRRSWRPVPLVAYLVALVVLVAVVAGVDVVYLRHAAAADARQAALGSAGFGAGTAARQIGADLGQVRAQVAALAATPAIGQAFGASAGCTLQFGGAGAFSTGHIDLVRADGGVGCSSLAPRKQPGYAGAAWLGAALKGPVLAVPVTDARTGQQVAVVAAPVPGKGAVAAFLNLDSLGPGLFSTLGGARHMEFVATTANGKLVLARSIHPGAWVGRPVAGTPFAGAAGQAEHRDLSGTPRFYGQSAVPQARWRVFAGVSAAQALAAATRLSNHELALTLAGLVVVLLGALVLYRRIARPITSLGTGVRAATGHLPAGPVPVAGPAEVSALAGDVNQLITAANGELEARSRLAAIAESSTDAIVGVTLGGVITGWNAGAEHMTGYSRQEMTGSDVSVLVPPGGAGELAAVLARVAARERVEQFETRCLRKDGSAVELSCTLSPVTDAGGGVSGAAMVARDMTERRALEHRLRQSERLESLGQLAGGVAHDFNNLLAAILNYAGFVAEETAKPEVRADAEQIRAAAERAARLTRQLLLFSRRDTIQAEVLDLNAIVADIHNLLSRSIGAHIELKITPAAGLPAIEADRGQVEQVLLNLAINARDAMPEGGTLMIATGLAELDDGYARMHPGVHPGRYVKLTVTDTGTGMSAEVAAHIFEPFFTTKPADRGTGLGLSTVYGIITQAGGSVGVESEEGTGTTFSLYLPAVSTAVAPAAPGAAPQIRGNGETILVVDDEPAVLDVTSRILRHSGYATLAAATYEQALSLAGERAFQLLLTDSVMPKMSGATLAERVAVLRPGVPVLYMSGYNPATPGPPGVPKQGTATIQKPFDPQTLLEAVHAALNPPAAASPPR